MKRYKSHKVVHATRIADLHAPNSDAGPFRLVVRDDPDSQLYEMDIPRVVGDRFLAMAADAGTTVNGGWLLEYADGYLSWSPHKQFMEGYRPYAGAVPGVCEDFGAALDGMRYGEKWAREGWSGRGMWVTVQYPDANSKMRRPYLYMLPVDGNLVPWVASQSDLLADDWVRVG